MSWVAGIVVIGDEMLSGKVEDTNTPFLCKELHRIGWTVRKVGTGGRLREGSRRRGAERQGGGTNTPFLCKELHTIGWTVWKVGAGGRRGSRIQGALLLL